MCYECDMAARARFWGSYKLDCIGCAARAYMNAPESKKEHELDYFSRNSKFSRSDILERVEAMK